MHGLSLRQRLERQAAAGTSVTAAGTSTLYAIPANKYLLIRQGEVHVDAVAVAATQVVSATLASQYGYLADTDLSNQTIMQVTQQTPPSGTTQGQWNDSAVLQESFLVYGGPSGQNLELIVAGTTALVGASAWFNGYLLDVVEVERERMRELEMWEYFKAMIEGASGAR